MSGCQRGSPQGQTGKFSEAHSALAATSCSSSSLLQSQALDLSVSQKHTNPGLGKTVTGSRKRKMNSHPMRILATDDGLDVDGLAGGSVGNLSKRGVMVDDELTLLLDEDLKTVVADDPAALVNGGSATGQRAPATKALFSPNTARRDGPAGPSINCDQSARRALPDLYNNNQHKYLTLSSAKAILKNMSIMAREVKNLKMKLSNGTDDAHHSCCQCDSKFGFNERLSKLESKFDALQEKVEHIYATQIQNL